MRLFKRITLIILSALLLILLTVTLPAVRKQIRNSSRIAMKEAVIRAAVQCYCVEGAYPGSLEYLEKHYGLQINHKDYIVTYEVFASNIMPEVQILVRGEG